MQTIAMTRATNSPATILKRAVAQHRPKDLENSIAFIGVDEGRNEPIRTRTHKKREINEREECDAALKTGFPHSSRSAFALLTIHESRLARNYELA
jgi:hypothetical protein